MNGIGQQETLDIAVVCLALRESCVPLGWHMTQFVVCLFLYLFVCFYSRYVHCCLSMLFRLNCFLAFQSLTAQHSLIYSSARWMNSHTNWHHLKGRWYTSQKGTQLYQFVKFLFKFQNGSLSIKRNFPISPFFATMEITSIYCILHICISSANNALVRQTFQCIHDRQYDSTLKSIKNSTGWRILSSPAKRNA